MLREKGWALITGASSGIGKEIAKCFAQDGIPVILVARRLERLEALGDELSERYSVETQVKCVDLSRPDAPEALFQWVAEKEIQVDYLVNNAGIGVFGRFFESDWQALWASMQINMMALTELTYRFGRLMVDRGFGRILNVASTAAYQPGPWMAVYFATKAYVLWFSEALDEELRDSGVRVTALCPGATETEFQARAQMERSRFVHRRLAFMTAAAVARKGYEGMKRGRRVVITGWLNRLMVYSTRIIPRRLTTRLSKWVMEPE